MLHGLGAALIAERVATAFRFLVLDAKDQLAAKGTLERPHRDAGVDLARCDSDSVEVVLAVLTLEVRDPDLQPGFVARDDLVGHSCVVFARLCCPLLVTFDSNVVLTCWQALELFVLACFFLGFFVEVKQCNTFRVIGKT